MPPSHPQRDVWRWPTALLWLVFLLVGLFPEIFFYIVREAGKVVTQRAMINSPHVIQLAFAGYLGYFIYRRCLDAGLSTPVAQGKGLQLAIAGLIAFLPLLPDIPAMMGFINWHYLDSILFGALFVKVWLWLYLLMVLMRYYLWDGERVLHRMTSFFPSARREP